MLQGRNSILYRDPRAKCSTTHGGILCGFWFNIGRLSNPQDVVAAYQDLAQCTGADAIDKLFGITELDVHVQIDRDEPAFVLGLAPLEPHDNVFVDPASR